MKLPDVVKAYDIYLEYVNLIRFALEHLPTYGLEQKRQRLHDELLRELNISREHSFNEHLHNLNFCLTSLEFIELVYKNQKKGEI